MEVLYKKLYTKYKELKNREESQFDKLNRDQEEKFLNFAAAADEMIQYLKSETDKLHEQADELKSELASVRASSDEQKRLLMEENQKNEQLTEEISRLKKVEHNECSHCTTHKEIESRQENTHDTSGDEIPGESVITLTRKRKYVYPAESTVVPNVNVELDRQACQNVSIQQPACCQEKICSSEGDAADASSFSCMFQHLIELVLGMQVSPLTQSKEPCIMARHQSSGYSFSLTWITTSSGSIELLYRVLSLGTFERVAPEWMKETLMFSTSMCSIFFEKVSLVLKS